MDIVTNAIITCNEKVLLVRKRSVSGRPKAVWELPGGTMKKDDISVEHAVIRSVQEDVGVGILMTGRWFNNSFNNLVNIVVSAELCDERDAYKIKPSSEIQDYDWIPIETLADCNATPLTKDRILTTIQRPLALQT